jgi:zinc protease
MCGFAQISATAAPGHTLPEIERAVAEEIDRLSTDGPTDDEITRGRVQAETQFVQRLQNVGGFGGKSDQLNAYNTYLGRPDYFTEDLGRYERVTKDGLRTAVGQYLRGAGRVALSVVPRGRVDLALADSAPANVS